MSALSGMVEYNLDELTFTAWAGTPLAEIETLLAEHGQYLPFDPPLAGRGATLGGTAAAGLSGSSRYHYGGLRDFLLGVRYIDGAGQIVRGGGVVVKNAAGFDLPKLMVGSLGGLGALVDLSFKVFPKPQASATLRLELPGLDETLEALAAVAETRLEVDALDFEPFLDGYVLWVRLGGIESALPARAGRLKDSLGAAIQLDDAQGVQFWTKRREFAWAPEGWSLVKVPLTPSRVPALEASLAGEAALRRYVCGGQFAWLALEGDLDAISDLLAERNLSGLVVLGPPSIKRLGARGDDSFYRRVKAALDPDGRFVEA
jgi:glycolate oxidase FAD binding subunit